MKPRLNTRTTFLTPWKSDRRIDWPRKSRRIKSGAGVLTVTSDTALFSLSIHLRLRARLYYVTYGSRDLFRENEDSLEKAAQGENWKLNKYRKVQSCHGRASLVVISSLRRQPSIRIASFDRSVFGSRASISLIGSSVQVPSSQVIAR